MGEGAIGLSTAGFGVFLILASMIGGGISFNRISKNKKRWKGRFFGGFTVVVGVLILFLLGVVAFVSSVLGVLKKIDTDLLDDFRSVLIFGISEDHLLETNKTYRSHHSNKQYPLLLRT